MRLELHRLQRSLGVTTVYVTHDQEEAMTLADRVAVFMDGRIVQVWTSREVYATPRTAEVAAFIGTPPMNLLAARWEHEELVIDGERLPLGRSGGPRDVTLGVRPGDLRLADHGLAAVVERIEDLGDSAILSYIANGRLLKQKTDRLPDVREGEPVRLAFAPGSAHLFEPGSGARL
jgi:multiple sugar transport system ATP-binding protein